MRFALLWIFLLLIVAACSNAEDDVANEPLGGWNEPSVSENTSTNSVPRTLALSDDEVVAASNSGPTPDLTATTAHERCGFEAGVVVGELTSLDPPFVAVGETGLFDPGVFTNTTTSEQTPPGAFLACVREVQADSNEALFCGVSSDSLEPVYLRGRYLMVTLLSGDRSEDPHTFGPVRFFGECPDHTDFDDPSDFDPAKVRSPITLTQAPSDDDLGRIFLLGSFSLTLHSDPQYSALQCIAASELIESTEIMLRVFNDLLGGQAGLFPTPLEWEQPTEAMWQSVTEAGRRISMAEAIFANDDADLLIEGIALTQVAMASTVVERLGGPLPRLSTQYVDSRSEWLWSSSGFRDWPVQNVDALLRVFQQQAMHRCEGVVLGVDAAASSAVCADLNEFFLLRAAVRSSSRIWDASDSIGPLAQLEAHVDSIDPETDDLAFTYESLLKATSAERDRVSYFSGDTSVASVGFDASNPEWADKTAALIDVLEFAAPNCPDIPASLLFDATPGYARGGGDFEKIAGLTTRRGWTHRMSDDPVCEWLDEAVFVDGQVRVEFSEDTFLFSDGTHTVESQTVCDGDAVVLSLGSDEPGAWLLGVDELGLFIGADQAPFQKVYAISAVAGSRVFWWDA